MAASRGEVILAGSLLDAMTFWCGGFRNVTAAYGPEGLTDDLLTAFRGATIKRVLIAFARDEAGEDAASAASERLMAEGFACYRIEFPKGMGANTYTLKVGSGVKSLGLLTLRAAWLGRAGLLAHSSRRLQRSAKGDPRRLKRERRAGCSPALQAGPEHGT